MKFYYVYAHIDPNTQEIIYIGYGSGHRAWTFNALVFRQEIHMAYLRELIYKGFLPSEWVVIKERLLSKEDAMLKEKELIQLYKPIFNIQKGLGSMTDNNKKQQAKQLRSDGLSFSEIAERMNLNSSMTAWRYNNYAS